MTPSKPGVSPASICRSGSLNGTMARWHDPPWHDFDFAHYNLPMADSLMPGAPFDHGAMVLVTLNAPREKFWGAVLAMTTAGVCVRGISLESFDDFAHQLKSGESADPNVVFFPMHRVERIELDARDGEVPSLSERFLGKSGHNAIEVFYREVGG